MDDHCVALGMCRVRSSPACRTERMRSPEEPGPKGNAQTLMLQTQRVNCYRRDRSDRTRDRLSKGLDVNSV